MNAKIEYGEGKVWTQQGRLADGTRCLTLTKTSKAHPIGSKPANYEPKTVEECEVDCILSFKNIESARTLQDELNELISIWSRDNAQLV